MFARLAPLLFLVRSLVAAEDWWAFQPLEKPRPPQVQNVEAIDAFVKARLATQDLIPAPSADASTLIRRVHFDLTGLPPSFEAIEAFRENFSKDTYTSLVDRLLKSNHYGERWARHWLDVVRFAETNGYERDAVKPNIWKFRDWVVRAFNNDMSYHDFIRAQLAGDELENRTEASIIATGMLRLGPWNDEPNDPHEYKYERLEDMVDVVSTAFLGLTVKCARCHDHKFDPIPQRDYYRFAAAFWPGAIEPRDRELMGGPSADELGMKDVFGWTDIRTDPPNFHLLVKGDPHRPGEVVQPGLLSLVSTPDKPPKKPPPSAKGTQRRLQMADFIANPHNPLTTRVMVNRIWQHIMGQGIVRTPNNFGLKADLPSHPELLDYLAADFIDGGWKVKRLIRKIVLSETYQQASVHPLEKQQSTVDSSNRSLWKMNRRRVDAEILRDRLLSVTGELDLRMGGPSFYPVMAPEVLEGFSQKDKAWKASPTKERNRRSLYMMTKRQLLWPIMTAFDFPNTEQPCGKRDVTTVAPQALALLNNTFVHERSKRLAKNLLEEGDQLGDQIQLAWRRVLGREPSSQERQWAMTHVAQLTAHFAARSAENPDLLALASVCHGLVNSNEFLYVD
jgi:hypothetical protein